MAANGRYCCQMLCFVSLSPFVWVGRYVVYLHQSLVSSSRLALFLVFLLWVLIRIEPITRSLPEQCKSEISSSMEWSCVSVDDHTLCPVHPVVAVEV